MLWMGEEWAASTRWPFFTSHPQKDLGEAVSKGRIEEFADYGWDTSQMIDPQDPAAYRSAILDWSEAARPEHADVLELYRRLIALRMTEPDLRDGDLTRVHVDFDEDARWLVVHRGGFLVAANFADSSQPIRVGGREIVLTTGPAEIGADGLVLAPQAAAIVRA
jgi:maltooligosyltrehalose trehalohydrolase